MLFSYTMLTMLVAGVVFVNGWTDAPNAITSVVCTKALPFHKAVILSAVSGFCGLLLAWRCAPFVSNTISEMVDFSGVDTRAAMAAVAAAMAAVVAFSAGAWVFGIPTSESHAMIAALSGSAIACGGLSRISLAAWEKVGQGLLLSSVGGLAAGYFVMRLLHPVLQTAARRAMGRVQIAFAVLLSMLHGAQDGLKFVGVMVIADSLLAGRGMIVGEIGLSGSLRAVLLCAGVMSLGTLLGGRRIIEAVGKRMVQLQDSSATASDLAAVLLLGLATLLGLPTSTTHTKTCAVLGASWGAPGSGIQLSVMGEMIFAWAVTFPVCGAIGFLVSKMLL